MQSQPTIKETQTMRSAITMLLLLLSVSSNCQQMLYKPVESPKSILRDQTSFLSYYNAYLNLPYRFIAYDSNFNVMSQSSFLLEVKKGTGLPVKLISADTARYQLYSLKQPFDSSIFYNLETVGFAAYKYFRMVGKPLPNLNYTDIDGKIYDATTTKDKIVVLKCWFIHCTQCVAEMPEVNKIVAKYKNRSDIVFVGLTHDSKEKLTSFLQKTKFSYAVVADKTDYLADTLAIPGYPTHIIINKYGIVVAATNNYLEMEEILKSEAEKE